MQAVFAHCGNLHVLELPPGTAPRDLVAEYLRSGLVEFAEPDGRIRLSATVPNDPSFLNGTLWALHNTGQGQGLAGADIDAPEAWDTLTSAAAVVVAVVDTGLRSTHEDLAANLWTNPADGTHGFNALDGSHQPADAHGHGTRVAGVLGAVGNNGKGVAGVAWQAQIMACRFVDASGEGAVSDAIACLEFARTNGARIVNASWGTYEFSAALSNALFAARQADLLVVAAAGNDALDLDATPQYPAALLLDHIVSVAATTRRDELYPLSNTGAASVDLAAPGESIFTTDAVADDAYAFEEGTSFAAAQVTGACALLRARFPAENARQIIRRLLAGTDPLPALAGVCVSGGRLNLRRALDADPASGPRLALVRPGGDAPLELRLTGEPDLICVIEAADDIGEWTAVSTNTVPAGGTLVTPMPPVLPHRFFRARCVP